jgi:hypothetical protein
VAVDEEGVMRRAHEERQREREGGSGPPSGGSGVGGGGRLKAPRQNIQTAL